MVSKVVNVKRGRKKEKGDGGRGTGETGRMT
jgi:hypothetical protein